MTASSPNKKAVTTATPNQSASGGQVATKSATCCGCVDMRIGIFIILLFHLILGTYSDVKDLTAETPTDHMRTWERIASYVLFAISTIVYLVLFYAAAKRNVSVYRPAAKLNAAVFLASSVMLVALVGMKASPEMNEFEPTIQWVSVAIVLVWLGYWMWVVYKYAEVMEEEEQRRKNKAGRGSV